MYCHNCGTQLAQALSYCNQCGANQRPLVDAPDVSSGTTIDTLLWVIVGTIITLLGMALGALVLMNNGQINERLGTAFVILTFAALLMTEGVLVWRLLKLNSGAKETRTAPQPNELGAKGPDPLTTRALQEPLEPVSSITEQNTRIWEPSTRKAEER
jgi:hypothetical protein